ncbi:hypothetical protein OGAPHI_003777 [Ogataea philodendri]|uniref:Conserved oligomeric Golgi complex subunit 6 n=1 Tax=Ogataea philodendri TaxID=1378263 RepID=A0A9P8P5T8_9ASCO|nr:uncharacterized protein OGAPHI_003777 [Ogataea philodendri]KAH3665590.1 hypothetical protein OGAPHI_003777 [Ogataea philodendri]
MDFVFDTYDDYSGNSRNSSLPVPSAPLTIPNFPLQGDITRKFSNLNILNHIKPKGKDQDQAQDTVAFRYAKSSLDLILSSSDTPAPLGTSSETTDSNVLAGRLSRVLNQFNFDSSIRQSLLLLQSRTEDQQISADGGIDYKNLTSPNMLGSITRRKLRGDIESELLRQHFQSLKKFQLVVKKLNVIRQDLEDLNSCYDEIDQKLDSSLKSVETYKKGVKELIGQRDLVKIKKGLLSGFRTNFTLSVYEDHLLRAGNIDRDFFNVVAKVEKIYSSCDILLSMNNDKLGISIMNQMSNLQQIAIDRISSFLRKNLNSIYIQNDFAQDAESIANFQRALVFVLTKNKDEFDSIVSEIIESRSRIVTEEFLGQLNGYTNEIRTKPSKSFIMASYDSKRYVSDVLAYLHSVIVNELELVESLFTFDREVSTDLAPVIRTVVNKVLGSLSRPLKSSYETILRQESKPGVVVELYQLLELYKHMFDKLTKQNDLIDSLTQLQHDSFEKLLILVTLKLREIKVESEIEEVDEEVLSLPDWLIDFYSEFLVIFDYQNSTDKTFLNVSVESENELFRLLVDEPIELLERIVKKLSFSKKSKTIFTINCVDFIVSKLELISCLGGKQVTAQGVLDTNIKSLISDEFTQLLRNSGLFDIYNLINMIYKLEDDFFDVALYEPITENKLFNVSTFQNADQKLQEFLIGYLVSNELNKLISPKILNTIFITSTLQFVKFYRKLRLVVAEYLVDSDNQPINVFRWDDMHVATLLGVEEAYETELRIIN